MIKYYLIACFVSFAILLFLRFVEGSPVRSWKIVLIGGAALSGLVCLYLHFVIPQAPAPAPVSQKARAYRAELERDFRRIAGVDRASINGSNVLINFAVEKPLEQLKRTAWQSGGTAAAFLRGAGDSKINVLITVRGQNRYRLVIPTHGGQSEEEVF